MTRTAGDPTKNRRGAEEAMQLAKAGVPFRFLPGITSALGALADAGIPATMRGVNKGIIFVTGHSAGDEDDVDWAALARTGQPIVIYMGMANLARIAASLVDGGLADTTPAAVIMSATTPDERMLTAQLTDIAARAQAEGIGAPAIIVVGDIVAARAALAVRETSDESA